MLNVLLLVAKEKFGLVLRESKKMLLFVGLNVKPQARTMFVEPHKYYILHGDGIHFTKCGERNELFEVRCNSIFHVREYIYADKIRSICVMCNPCRVYKRHIVIRDEWRGELGNKSQRQRQSLHI